MSRRILSKEKGQMVVQTEKVQKIIKNIEDMDAWKMPSIDIHKMLKNGEISKDEFDLLLRSEGLAKHDNSVYVSYENLTKDENRKHMVKINRKRDFWRMNMGTTHFDFSQKGAK
jgi:hypothetical protein